MRSLHPSDAERKGFGHSPTSILNLIFRNRIQKLQVGTSLHCLRKLNELGLTTCLLRRFYITFIEITHNGKLVASGSFDVETGEMGRNIYIYTPV